MKWIIAAIVILALLPTGPAPSEAAGGTASVNVNTLNVRKGPGLNHAIIMKIHKGESYQVTSGNGDWLELSINGKRGWVAGWLVNRKQSPAETSSPSNNVSNKAIVSSKVDGLRVRTGPGLNFQVIGSISRGPAYNVIKRSGSWVMIDYSGKEGWVYGSYLADVKNQEAPQENASDKAINKAVVTADILNVRSGPSTSHSIVGKLKSGNAVAVHDVKNGWYKIKFGDLQGWIAGTYAKKEQSGNVPDQSSEPAAISGKTAVVTASALNIRDTYSTRGNIIGSVRQGDKVTVLKETNKWAFIQYGENKQGWAAGWYLKEVKEENSQVVNGPAVTILHNGTNIRKGPGTSHAVAARANQGDTFPIVNKQGDWYKIKLANGAHAYVAGWIVSASGDLPDVARKGSGQYLKSKTIVLDPGHGGRDPGTAGRNGAIEKRLTLQTAQILAQKLKAAGANVILTRTGDGYVSLGYRVSVSHYHNADAFVSLHYDSSVYSSAHGISSYYFNKTKDYPLSAAVQDELTKQTGFRSRGVKYGNFQVLRTNRQPAMLAELGFLSNPSEELSVMGSTFQDRAATGLYNGLARFFSK
ncbi:SH3 domain-containing protein [Bacillus marinisedimentorum]|uniref:SH3 domain-containing protein n=1 Tax=Bacillus marinisedimentorum TaxID=1821260 RepID=UPI001470DA3D|nr:SH3 domain-containing protein [Bacillus marinisedimentorum]